MNDILKENIEENQSDLIDDDPYVDYDLPFDFDVLTEYRAVEYLKAQGLEQFNDYQNPLFKNSYIKMWTLVVDY